MRRNFRALLRRLRREEGGSTLIFAAVGLLAFTGMAGIVVDVGYVYHAKRTLQISTDSAALAGATQLSSGPTAALAAANAYSAGSGGNNAIADLDVTATPTTMKCTGNTGATCTADSSAPNAIKVTETATVPFLFAKALGFNSSSISTTAYATPTGGKPQDYDIVIILDTTASMNTLDGGCAQTRISCALAGFRTLLQGFTPPTQRVGLMIFPGLKNTTAASEYDCNALTPTALQIAAYDQSPIYSIVPLSSDYKSGSSLNSGSNLVKAAYGASGCAGISAIGGVGTFYADVIVEAKNYLRDNARQDAKKMIIFLGDGAANSTAVASGDQNNQCRKAYNKAKAAEQDGVIVVTIGFGAKASGCTTDNTGTYGGTSYQHNNPCGTLLAMATVGTGTAINPQWFYSDTGSDCHGSNSATNLSAIFSSIGTNVTSGRARLILSN